MTECLQTDVLILGCGIAGGTAAVKLAEAGLSVTIATRAADPSDSNTYYAQGGIIYQGHEDAPDKLAADIARAGAGHCNPRAVHLLAEEGPRLVREFLAEKLGVHVRSRQ